MSKKLATAFFFASAIALAQYKLEPAGAPPAEAGGAAASLQSQGHRIVGPSGPYAEIWFVKAAPSGPKNAEEGVSLPTVPQGALMGVIRFPASGSDRRGQQVKPGVYTLRYSLHPVNGDHLGVAPNRDFLLLVPIAEDQEPSKNYSYDELVALSKKASATPHPAVLSISAGSGDKFPNLAKEGEKDWVLSAKLGDTAVALIVIGKVEA